MFSSFFGAAGGANSAEIEQSADQGSSRFATEEGDSNLAHTNQLKIDFWNLSSVAANVAASVTKTVTERAYEAVQSVQQTDWKNELSVFTKVVKEDTQDLAQKTREAAEHLPETAAALPSALAEKLPHVSGSGAALENVGDSLSLLGKTLLDGTKGLFEQVRDGIEEEIAAATKDTKRRPGRSSASNTAAAANTKATTPAKYSRFEAEVASMQRDSNTYLDEPEDVEDFETWKSRFSISGVKEDIKKLLASNSFMSELQSRIVPDVVEEEEFWTRYFYRLHKLNMKEEQRLQVAMRAQHMSIQEEEELGWDDLDPDSAPKPEIIGSATIAAATQASSNNDSRGDADGTALNSCEPDAEVTGRTEAEVVSCALEDEASLAVEAPARCSVEEQAGAAADMDTTSPQRVGLSDTVLSTPLNTASSSQTALPDHGSIAAQPLLAEAVFPAGSVVKEVDTAVNYTPATSAGGMTAGQADSPAKNSSVTGVDIECESIAAAETSSDSSGREWCVVVSPTAKALERIPQPCAGDAGDYEDTKIRAESTRSESAVAGIGKSSEGQQPKQLKPRPKPAGGDEEDLDWGNWD
ncbi:hypothetical protein CEUSTIGMA_g10100.t1 [Chlamydomonas eustigma]|uniref:BSD domain-containing protein n=1 Tax=Chlamydomonas eustigma TaxID=1157962 RepID=A0A250XHX3_9CHLO|nr:hypothetical protein CEUSTIGMA_g10100.t1 [Chlamydomonas eustigma]|eukprot:GAX82674.1 hypothetical protein CEUSTIGMA_g10100.t1 [Chlamydomonas eustigma]